MARQASTFSPVNGSVLPGSAGVVEVVLGAAVPVALVDCAALAPVAAGGELGLDALVDALPDEFPVEVPVEFPVELLFEPLGGLVGDGLWEELVGWLEGLVQVASGSTYCWLPADGEHPPWASAPELSVSPSASEARTLMTIRDRRVTGAIEAMLKNERAVTVSRPPDPAGLQ
jgi:hypothetical protein